MKQKRSAPRSKAIYIGVDNLEELEVVFTKKTRTDIQRLAKRAGMNEAELLAKYLGEINLAALSGISERMRLNKRDERKAPRKP